MMTLPLSQEKQHWQIAYMFNKGTGSTLGRRGGRGVVQGQGQDTSCTGSNLQSVGSLVSDKNIVNQETKETPAWAACLYKTDRASTSVSHFVRIYTSWSKVPCLIIVEGQNPNQNWDCSIIAWLPYMAPRDHLSSESRLWLLKIDCARVSSAWRVLPSNSWRAVKHIHICNAQYNGVSWWVDKWKETRFLLGYFAVTSTSNARNANSRGL